MNKLINRISPETSENRILHAGFSTVVYFIFVLVLILIGKAKAPQLIAGIKTPAPAAAEKMEAHEDDDQS